ncbi:hypothetical protein MGG_04669 [Pyricularia oryzae 70-15]|uniref:Cytochrome b561 domain-containing protein n=1 Tax=Pyricularia oryzae (strain 70-15 / ATCC MYA-4617 / FGSC 8958) TaxID=242507 RepID=G4MTB1_PYRO7|nr:uncharacterized protein MGG_04669 [Pyricularia oryzae 70-15]EHA53857.1 hypothetical protein MGG_04669 [Pyricularia oryzae 70-15]
MAPADFSPPGTASYTSDTLNVGDGTWDFTKNTFLLPNLQGLDFETMQYNGMGNRFSTVGQYHTLILAHGILATMAFLFLVPAAVMTARFYTGRAGFAVKYHAYMNVLALGLVIVVFILGWFAVGPTRSLTNPHHGIGVAILVLFILQAFGGRLISGIKGRSLRVTVHQWSGRAIALLGIVQIPLGLTLYGSPKYCFILYALWMTTLLLIYFILSYKASGRRDEYYLSGARSDAGRSRVTEITETDRTERTERTDRRSSGGAMKWLGPLAAGAGAFALFSKSKKKSTLGSRSRSRSRSRMRSRSRAPEVLSSRRGESPSTGYFDDEKYSERVDRRKEDKGGGFMTKVLGVGAALGAGGLLAKMKKKKDTRRDETEYSAVSSETPTRYGRGSRRGDTVISEYTDYTDTTSVRRDDDRRRPRSPLLPGPGGPTMAAGALSAAASRPGTAGGRPVTPPQSHRRNARPDDSLIYSDYSSYRSDSPSRRLPPPKESSGGGVGKGILAGLGLGWFAKKMKDRRDRKEDDRMRMEDEERRAGQRPARYTGDGFDSPTRRHSRPQIRNAGRPAPSQLSEMTMTESSIEPRPPTGYGAGTSVGPAPVPVPVPVPAGGPPPPASGPSRSRSQSRHDTEYVSMPAMPRDPYEDSPSDRSPGVERTPSSRRRRESEAAAQAAQASASRLASSEDRRWGRDSSVAGQPRVSVKVKGDDRGNVTLRQLTREEASAERREQRRRQREDDMSSLSGNDTPTGGSGSRTRYRRDSDIRKAESAAEQRVRDDPLSMPPAPPFAGGRRPAGKDSAYFSGQPGPASGGVGNLPAAGHTVSTLESAESHGTWSQMSVGPGGPPGDPSASAAERRRRRRLERRDQRPGQGSQVEFN